MKNLSLVCFVEKPHFHLIKEQFYTIRKYCHGYNSFTYILDGNETEEAEIKQFLELNDVNVLFLNNILVSEYIPYHLKRTYITLTIEDYIPKETDMVMLTNPTAMFFIHHTWLYFLENNNKLQLIAEDINKVEHLKGSLHNIKNRLIAVSDLFEKQTDMYFGTERCAVFHKATFELLRNYIIQKTNSESFIEGFLQLIKHGGSELELLASYSCWEQPDFYDLQVMQNYPDDLNQFPLKRLYHMAPLREGQFNTIINLNFSVKDFNKTSYQQMANAR